MKAKQKNLRIFDIEITNDKEFFDYMNKNLILLKDFFLLLNGEVSDPIISYLNDNNLCFKISKECNIKVQSKQNSINNRAIMPKNEQQTTLTAPLQQEVIKTRLVEKPIRSGEEIIHEGDVTIFGRVNSAARVIAEGNVEIYGLIDGLVQCDGDYMIIKDIGKGHVIFNGDILNSDDFDGNLKKVTKSVNGAIIKDIFETTHY